MPANSDAFYPIQVEADCGDQEQFRRDVSEFGDDFEPMPEDWDEFCSWCDMVDKLNPPE